MNRLTIGTLIVGFSMLYFSCNTNTHNKNAAIKVDAADSHPITDTLTTDPEHYAVISVSDTLHEFGTIRQGDVVSYAFRIQNTGSKPLIIREAASTCGCTVPEYPKEPIRPGEYGQLKVEFNSAGKSGRQVKPIFIQANTHPTLSQLTIACTVKATKENN